jgi:hypothetical protein
MSFIHKQLILLITMLLINSFSTQTTTTQIDCRCPSTAPAPPQPLADKPADYIINRETINGSDYGAPLVLGKYIFLTTDFTTSESYEKLEVTCPIGWRPPTSSELQDILNQLGSNAYKVLTDLSGFNAEPEFFYLSSTKSFPQKTDLTDNDTWNFKGIYIDSAKQQVTLVDVNTYWEPYKSTRCIMDSSLPIVSNVKDLYTGQTYPFSVARSNLVSSLWDYDGTQSTQPTLKTSFNTAGCHLVQVWAKSITNEVLYSCKKVYAVKPFGSDGNSQLDITTIQSVDVGVKAVPNNNLFFSPSISPVAPKDDGGFYLAYVDATDSNLYVAEYDKAMKQLSKKNLNLQIVPMDLIATPWGFVVFARQGNDTNNGFLIAYNADYTQKWKRTLQNNGVLPTAQKEQITFYDSTGAVLDGNQVNFAIGNGKLAYGRGRISLIYGRYNHFGIVNGARNDHTGDAYLTFDEKDGQDEKYSWVWLSSHSLYQTHAYNGQFFITAALGDDYPQNIQVCVVDQSVVDDYVDGVRGTKVRHPKYCTKIVPGSIPGDGKGNSCGRLGGLHFIQDQYALIYQRKPCRILNQSTNTYVSNTLNELAVLSFTFDPVKLIFSGITKKVVVTSTDAIMSVRSAKYGNKILISYAQMAKAPGTAVTNNNYYIGTETTYNMLVGFDGTIATNKLLAPVNSTPLSNDMEVLADGTVVWSFIDLVGNLKLYYTAAPPLLQNLLSMVLSTPTLSLRKAAKVTVGPTSRDSTSSSTKLNSKFLALLLVIFAIVF